MHILITFPYSRYRVITCEEEEEQQQQQEEKEEIERRRITFKDGKNKDKQEDMKI